MHVCDITMKIKRKKNMCITASAMEIKRTIVYLISQPHCIQAIENLNRKQTCEMQLGIVLILWFYVCIYVSGAHTYSHVHIKHNSLRWKEK